MHGSNLDWESNLSEISHLFPNASRGIPKLLLPSKSFPLHPLLLSCYSARNILMWDKMSLRKRTYKMTFEVWTVMKIQTTLYYITRWFKYDRDKLWLVYTQSVPVIFEPPCILQNYFTIMTSFYSLESECQRFGENNCLHLQDRNEVADDDGNFSDSSVLMY